MIPPPPAEPGLPLLQPSTLSVNQLGLGLCQYTAFDIFLSSHLALHLFFQISQQIAIGIAAELPNLCSNFAFTKEVLSGLNFMSRTTIANGGITIVEIPNHCLLGDSLVLNYVGNRAKISPVVPPK
ncbi:hypothetical protein HAX54_011215 [Datura stramonium]|uniref:Uncharacterized protein n=1 Tax=Datura stramonium TaxID=4076 RepID=A0ABS8THH9_DATST|nr:hypothetical protein [Datura stramonium]